MTVTAPDTRRAPAGRTAPLLVALVSVVLAIVPGAAARVDAHASTPAAEVPETRVRAPEAPTGIPVGPADTVLPGQGRRTTTLSPRLVVGFRVAPRSAVTDLADSYPSPPGVGDPRTVAVLDTPSGGSYPGRSGFPGQPHAAVREALDAVPPGARSPFHGQCAEIHCLMQAFEAGDDVAGGTLSTARVRGPNSPAHGTPIPPCPSCQPVLDKLGVRYR